MRFDKCCFVFPLKTGVWLIGLAQLIGLSIGIYNLESFGMVSFFGFNLLAVFVWCCMFLVMMLLKQFDTQYFREVVFVYYVVVLTILPIQYTLMGTYNVGFDITSHICEDMQAHAALNDGKIDSDKCLTYVRTFYMVSLVFTTAIHAYLAYFLKLYADVQSLSKIKLDQ